MPVVRTDGRSLARSVYGHVITKFSRMVDYHISLVMGLRPRTAEKLNKEEVNVESIGKETVEVVIQRKFEM